MGTVKHGVPKGSVSRLLLFIIYITDTMNILSEPILFSDATIVIISGKNFDDFSPMSSTFLSHMSK
jgi:hypothetical protein